MKEKEKKGRARQIASSGSVSGQTSDRKKSWVNSLPSCSFFLFKLNYHLSLANVHFHKNTLHIKKEMFVRINDSFSNDYYVQYEHKNCCVLGTEDNRKCH